MISQFELLYNEVLECSKGHIQFPQILMKIIILAGEVYEGEEEIEKDLFALSKQLYDLIVMDEIQKCFIFGKNNVDFNVTPIIPESISNIKGKLGQLPGSIEYANIPKILGWALKKAKSLGVYRT